MTRMHWLLLVFGFLLLAPGPASATVDEASARHEYRAALTALRAGEFARFRAIRDGLDTYVLRGYLDYEYLKDRLDTAPVAEVHAFLERYSYIPGSDAIRKRWLRQLAARGQWDAFFADYANVEGDVELQCLRLNRLVRTSERPPELMQEIEALWRNGRRLPATCNAAFAAWNQAGHMTPERVWERIRLAMEARQLTLASELAQHLEVRERVWVTRWLALDRDPAAGLARIDYPVETPVARMVVRHGVVRLGFRDVDAAIRRWDALKQKYEFFGEDDDYVLRYLGILAAQARSPEAVPLLSRVRADPGDESLLLWRVRAALLSGMWHSARRFIAALPQELQQKPEWRYWQARALDRSGQDVAANALFQPLARERSYYGFLAADHVGVPYAMQHRPVAASAEEINAMLERPGVLAARELHAMGLMLDARRQWQWSTRHMNRREAAVAAVVARTWGWHDRAILTVNRSDSLDDLDIRFPLLYRDMIEASAERHGLEPSWVYGVVRQESAFVPDARSSAGALGLMQIMPATGRLTGQQLKLPYRGAPTLLDVDSNIKLGVGYLKSVFTRYGSNQTLATAAYNAGPSRVSSWMPVGRMDADVWVETIPFTETREYVKNVMAFTAVYDHRLGVEPVRLRQRMPEVAPKSL